MPQFLDSGSRDAPTSEPDTFIIESHGGGPTADGRTTYTQRYFSLITNKDGLAFRMREYCNPFQTYKAFGKAHWETSTGEIMRKYNKPWPASQKPDPISLPPVK